MLELVNQYKEAAQLIEAAQAEQELIKAHKSRENLPHAVRIPCR